jgi:hypothetical protein
LKTFDVMGSHQGFIYMLLTFKLLKLFRKPVVLLCVILMLYCVAPWRRKFSRLNVLFICYGTAVEHRSLLNRSGICDGINRCNICLFMQPFWVKKPGIYFSPQKRLKHGRQNITLHWINDIIRNNKCIFTKLNAVFLLKTAAWTKTCQIFFFPRRDLNPHHW